jgi:hypothetical protein
LLSAGVIFLGKALLYLAYPNLLGTKGYVVVVVVVVVRHYYTLLMKRHV